MANIAGAMFTPSISSVMSMYTTFAAAMMMLRTALGEIQSLINQFARIINQFIPETLRTKILSKFGALFGDPSSSSSLMTLTFYELSGSASLNEMYGAPELYLSHKLKFDPSIKYLEVSKEKHSKSFSICIEDQTVVDTFDGIEFIWEFLGSGAPTGQQICRRSSTIKSIQLSFDRKHRDKVLSSYLPHVVERAEAIKEERKTIRLHSLGSLGGSVIINHPFTFDSLALDPKLKKEIIDDLNRFVKRKELYQRVGKPWKRGYLLYGPPGTGKSSLIAAMANYLKFDIYEMELTELSNSDLKRTMLSTRKKSILVLEDVDCSSAETQDRSSSSSENKNKNKLTLSGLLNTIDGLGSSMGDERIIVLTTNYKERLDPALLRPGRMDKHIHMSYCTPSAFTILASNYLQINAHHLFYKIQHLIEEVEVTPAEVAEQLLASEEVDTALELLVDFLQIKKQIKCCQSISVEETSP